MRFFFGPGKTHLDLVLFSCWQSCSGSSSSSSSSSSRRSRRSSSSSSSSGGGGGGGGSGGSGGSGSGNSPGNTTDAFFLLGKTHLHVMLLPFLRSFPELALDHGFAKNES